MPKRIVLITTLIVISIFIGIFFYDNSKNTTYGEVISLEFPENINFIYMEIIHTVQMDDISGRRVVIEDNEELINRLMQSFLKGPSNMELKEEPEPFQDIYSISVYSDERYYYQITTNEERISIRGKQDILGKGHYKTTGENILLKLIEREFENLEWEYVKRQGN